MSHIPGRDPRWPYPGARWWKFDFHTHTPASNDYGKGSEQETLRDVTPRDWLLGFMRAEVDCVAVTDHNSGEWIDNLKEALLGLQQEPHPDYRPLYLFPGMEITANGGIHVLAIFDPGKGTADITTLLGAVGYRGDRGASDEAADSAPKGVVKAIGEAGGIPILAHVDGPSGAWGLSGNTLTPLFDLDDLFAMEVVDPAKEKPGLYRQRKLAWAEVLGSDSHHPGGPAGSRFPGSHYTWIKMADPPSLNGLRLALLDGARFSIRRSDKGDFNPFTVPQHFIESIRIQDARYMGRGQSTKLHFSPMLNAIVGGRGTGKSTVVHALRLASRREGEILSLEEGSIPRTTFARFNKVYKSRADDGALTDNTKIQWIVARDRVRHRVTWQPDGSSVACKVEDEMPDGSWAQSSSQSVTPERFPVRIFSQGQIAELAGESRPALLPLIDELAGVLQKQLQEAINRYFISTARIRELDGQLAREGDLAVGLEDVERKLKRFDKFDHSTVLKAYRTRARQDREANRQFAGADDAARRIAALADKIELESLPEGVPNGASQAENDYVQVMKALGAAVDVAADALRRAAARLREATGNQRNALSGSSWQLALDQANADYKQLVGELQAEGVADPAEFGHLVQERHRITEAKKILDSKKKERDRRVAECLAHLDQVGRERRAISQARERFLSQALEKNEFVRISVRRYGVDDRAIERSLRDTLGVLDDRFESDILKNEDGRSRGMVADLLQKLSTDTAERGVQLEDRLEKLKGRLTSACLGEGDFGGHFNNYLKRKYERDPAFVDRLWGWFPEDELDVEYSRQGDGRDFRPIGQASAGQRSAAMLAFLLAYGHEPLVLDQPEDDLDNHLIYDLVVRQIRENKLRRQIIVVTHNANIVVNGDAEMLHAMEFRNGQCVVSRRGSLQDRKTRDEICRVMEGGRRAFESRYRRLGPESAFV